MAERTAVWKIAADFSRVRREAKKSREELERLERKREELNETSLNASKDSVAADRKATVENQRYQNTLKKGLGVLASLSAAKRRDAAATRALTDAEREAINTADQVVAARRRVDQALLSSERAHLALEAAQRRLMDIEKKHGAQSDQYARALISVNRRTLDAEAASNRHADASRRLSSVLQDTENAVRGLDGRGNGLVGTLGRVAGGFGRATFSAKLFGGSLRTLGIVALIPAISMLVTWLSQLSAGAVAAIGPLTRLAGVLAALPQAVSVAGGAIATFLGAFSGIGEALKQGVKAQQEAGQASKDLAKAERDSARQIELAERGVRDAREAAAESARQNARAVREAEYSAQQALRQSREAHQDLIETREEERRRVQDLMDSLKDLELQERGAALSVEEARQRLNAVMIDPGATDLAKAQAQLAYDSALAQMDQVQKDRKRVEKDAKEADEKGIEGSDAVVEAKEREADANKGLMDAEYALAEARRQQAKAARDSAEAVKDAQYALREAHRSAADAQTQATGAANAYNDALKELSPAGRAFVRLLMGMRDELKRLKFAAQEGLLPGLGRALTTMLKLMPLAEEGLFRFGQIMGRTAEKGANMLTSGPFTEMFTRILRSNYKLLRLSGDGFLNIVSALTYLADAARPFTEWLFTTVEGWTQFWQEAAKAGNETGGIARYLEGTREILEILGRSMSNLWDTFKNLGKAGSDLGWDLWNSFERITQGWADWTGSIEGQNQLKEWFDNARDTLQETSELLGAIMRGFFDLGRTESVAPIIKSIREDLGPALYDIMKNLQGEFGQALVDIISGIARLVAALTSAGEGGLTTFARTVADVVGALASFIEDNPAVQAALSGLLKGLGVLAALNFLTTILGLRKILGLLTGGKGLAGALKVLRPLFGLLLTPAGAVAAAIVALGIAGYVLYKKWKPFRDAVNEVAGFLRDNFLAAWKELKPALEEAKDKIFGQLAKSAKDLGKAFSGEGGVADSLKELWKVAKPILKFLMDVWTSYAKVMISKVYPVLFKVAAFILGTVIKSVARMVSGVIRAVTGIIKVFEGLIKVVTGIFTGDWQKVWDGAKQIFDGFVDLFMGSLDFFIGSVGIAFKLLWAVVKKAFEYGIKAVWGFIKGAWKVVKWLLEPFTKIPGALRSAWGKIADTIGGALTKIGTTIKDFISDKIGDFVQAFKDIPKNLRELGGRFKDAGSSLLDKLLEGLGAAGNFATDFANTIYGAIKKVVDFGIDQLNGFLKFEINPPGPGPKLSVDVPDIPHLPESPIKRNRGGGVPGMGNRDTVPAMLTPGEFVLRQDAVKRIGVSNLHAINEGRTPRKFAKGGPVPWDRKRRKKYPDHQTLRPAGYEGYFGDAAPVQKFHKGGVVLGMSSGAKGPWVKALEAMTGQKMDGTWDRITNRLLRDGNFLNKPAWGVSRSGAQNENLLKWVNAADVQRTLQNKTHKVTKGETVRDILKSFYGDRYERHFDAFLKANNFYDTKRESHTVNTPGGASDALTRALKFAAAQSGKPYIWGGVGPRGYDCSGYQSAITNVIKGRNPYARLFATGSMSGALPGLGFRPGLGGQYDYSVGWYTGSPGHTAGTLGSLNVESTGDHVRNGSAAKGAGFFPNKMHLPLGKKGGKKTIVKQRKDARYNLASKLPAGLDVKMPDVEVFRGARTWADAKDRFNVDNNQLVTWLRSVWPQFSKLGKNKTAALSQSYSTFGGAFDTALTALNTKLGLKGAGYTDETKNALTHVLAHAFGRKHDNLSYRPWQGWTPVEAAIITQEIANDRARQWESAMTTLATWGFEDLIADLFEKGYNPDGLPGSDDPGFNTAISAAGDYDLAKQLNDAIKAGGSFSADDIEKIIRMIAYLNSIGAGRGLRDVARKLGISDYNVVKLWQDGNASGKFNGIPQANRAKLDQDIASYNAGTFYFNSGGSVPGVGNSDSVPAMLTPGEFVIKKQAAKALGLSNLWALNNLQKFNGGGLVMGPNMDSIPTRAVAGVSTRNLAQNVQNITNNYETNYDVDINNPVAEPGTYSMMKMLQRQSALGRDN